MITWITAVIAAPASAAVLPELSDRTAARISPVVQRISAKYLQTIPRVTAAENANLPSHASGSLWAFVAGDSFSDTCLYETIWTESVSSKISTPFRGGVFRL